MKRTPFHTIAAIACSGTLAISLAGCGSSDKKNDTSSDKSATLSATDFKKQANALCKTANAEIATIEQNLASATTEDDATAVIKTMTDRIDKLITGIKDLKEPADLTDGVDAMLSEVTSVLDDMKSQGIDYFRTVTADPFEKADAKAREIGLPDCAGDN